MQIAFLLSALTAFLSGSISLGLELIWFRYCQLLFGNTVYATSLVTAFFMAGMAAGNAFWGRVADRNAPLVLRLLFIGTAFFAVISPSAYWLLSFLHTHLASFPMHGISLGITMVAGGTVLAVPAFLTGGIVPSLVAHRNGGNSVAAAKVGLLYGLYTMGGAAGALGTVFVMMPTFGLRDSLFVIGLLQAVCMLCIRKSGDQRFPNPAPAVAAAGDGDKRLTKNILLLFFALSGFTALSYEVLWTRILILIFRNSIYDFALVLSATLSGMVIGSFLCGAVIQRIRRPVILFAVLQVLAGGAAILSLVLVYQYPSALSFLQSMPELYSAFGMRYWLMGNSIRFLAAFVIVAPQALLFGATFPLVSSVLLVRSRNGEDFGTVSAINGIGSALGSLIAGFMLISLFGISGSIRAIAIVNIALGVAVMLVVSDRANVKFAVGAVAAGMGVLLTIAVPRWDKLAMSQSLLDPRQNLPELLDLRYYNEDASGIVSVINFKPSGVNYLYTDRLFGQNSSAMNGPEDHRRLGQIPVILHGGARNALLIGLGAGITLRGVVETQVDDITCVEVSKNVQRAAGYFDDVNGGVLRNPAVRIVTMDGRTYLSSVPALYDVIIGDIFFPMSSGSGTVYSREFFTLCKKRLAARGVYCQWLPLHQLSLEELRIVVATFLTVFPDAQLWYGMIGRDTPVIGCVACEGGPLPLDFEQLARWYDDPVKTSVLRAIELGDPMVFLSNFIAASPGAEAFSAGAVCSTDDKPVIEFLNPRDSDSFRARGEKNREALQLIQQNIFETGIVR